MQCMKIFAQNPPPAARKIARRRTQTHTNPHNSSLRELLMSTRPAKVQPRLSRHSSSTSHFSHPLFLEFWPPFPSPCALSASFAGLPHELVCWNGSLNAPHVSKMVKSDPLNRNGRILAIVTFPLLWIADHVIEAFRSRELVNHAIAQNLRDSPAQIPASASFQEF